MVSALMIDIHNFSIFFLFKTDVNLQNWMIASAVHVYMEGHVETPSTPISASVDLHGLVLNATCVCITYLFPIP